MFSYGEKTKKWLLLFLKFSVTISLIGIAAAYVDFEKFIQYVEKLSYGSFLLATLSLVVQIFVLGLRWQKILIPFHGHNLSYFHSLRIVFIGFFFNQTLPSSVGGDAMRAWEAYKCGLPPRTAVNSVLLERFSGLFTLVLIMAAALPLIWHYLESSVIRWALVATVPLFAGIFVLILMLDRMPGAIRHISLVKKAATLSHDLRSVLANTEEIGRAHV